MSPLQIVLLSLLLVYCLLLALRRFFPKAPSVYFRYTVLLGTSVTVLAPFFWLVAAAFKDPSVLNVHLFLPPVEEWSRETLNLTNFRELFSPRQTLQGPVSFWRHIINSLFYASTLTVVQVFTSSLAGFALAKYTFRGRNLIMGFMLLTMMIPGIILLPPIYQMVVSIGWIDSYLSLIIPQAVSIFGIFLFRQTMLGIPNELLEAARIDGCGEFRIYWSVVVPLARPMTAAFCLVAFLGAWNNFIAPNIFLHSQHLLPLPVVLNQYVSAYSQQYGVFLAGTLLAMVPPAILFFILQRDFISGLTSGAVKG